MSTNLQTLQISLRIHKLLHDIEANLFQECLNEIIVKLFGGSRQMLSFVVKSSKMSNLNIMHNIIKQKKIANKNKDIPLTSEEKAVDSCNEEDIPLNITFETLPNECIDHICDYLSKTDVWCFKRTSRQMGIVCLDHMTKVTVSTILYYRLKENDFKNNMKNMQQSRYRMRTKFYSIQEEWDKIYGIPEENQLVFPINTNPASVRCLFPTITDINKWNLCKVQKGSYLIVDNRNVVILNGCMVRKLDPKIDKFDKIKKFRLMILEYFDVMKQSSNIVQFILYNPMGTTFGDIHNYIENNYINTHVDDSWYRNLSDILSKMDISGTHHEKLIVWEQTSKPPQYVRDLVGYVRGDKLDQNLYTFQLHGADAFVQFSRPFEEKEEYFEDLADEFHSNVRDTIVTIEDRYVLPPCFASYYQTRFNDDERAVFQTDYNKKFGLNGITSWMPWQFETKMNYKSPAIWLKRKICRFFDNIIQPKHVELMNNGTTLKGNDPVSIRANVGTIYLRCRIVLYDTESFSTTTDKITSITVHKPNTGPVPFDWTMVMKNSVTISIRYKSDGTFMDLLNNLFETILKGTDHILYAAYKHLLDLCCDMNDDNDCDMIQEEKSERVFNDNMRYLFAGREFYNSSKVKQCYLLHENVFGKTIKDLNLFIMRDKPFPSEISGRIKVKIKFVKHDKTEKIRLNTKIKMKNINQINYIGLPLIIWVKRSDSLQNIIDEYLDKDCLWRCYQIRQDSVILIARNKWIEYYPYLEFLWNSNDFLVFTVETYFVCTKFADYVYE